MQQQLKVEDSILLLFELFTENFIDGLFRKFYDWSEINALGDRDPELHFSLKLLNTQSDRTNPITEIRS